VLVVVVVVVYFLAVPVPVGRVGSAMAPLYFHRCTTAYGISLSPQLKHDMQPDNQTVISAAQEHRKKKTAPKGV
jgi:hypothetical protein